MLKQEQVKTPELDKMLAVREVIMGFEIGVRIVMELILTLYLGMLIGQMIGG